MKLLAKRCCCFVVAAVLVTGFTSDGVRAQSFPFVIPGNDAKATITSRASLVGEAIKPDGDLVTVRGSHFYRGAKRIRFWGMNLCFGANLPTHEEADQLAPHFAKLGINAIRFHHMDMQNAPNGIWAPVNDQGVRNLDPAMVDRLDYFLAKLHENGIYADLNLHVSRTLSEAEGFPASTDNMPWWGASNKWVMYYDRDVQAEVKRYSHDLLTHKNPYRGNRRRVDDAGLALVEMLNENYFSVKGYDLYRNIPLRFQKSLIARWNEWLKKKYENHEAMVRAWSVRQAGPGAPVFPLAAWKSELEGWRVSKSPADLPRRFAVDGGGGRTAIRFEPKAASEQSYHHQLQRIELSCAEGQPLTLSYWVRADKERPYNVELSSSQGGEWRALGLFQTLTAGTTWKKVERVIIPGETVAKDVALSFSFGSKATPIEFSAIELRKGAQAKPLPADQSLTTSSIGIPGSKSSPKAHADMKQFMVDTEMGWIRELKSHLKTLGVKVPITASQVNYHDHKVHAELNDFVDLHNYWHHPLFPSGANWSPDRWTVGNDPMEADPTRSDWPANSLLMRTGWRVKGKPMTLSEWNYPEPGMASVGCIPMAAVLAGLQDWDAVFFFDYDAFSRQDGENPWFREAANNFFSFNGQPVKLAAFSQFANVFLRGDLKPLEREAVSTPDAPVSGLLGLTKKLSVQADAVPFKATDLPNPNQLMSANGQVEWTSKPPTQGRMKLNTAASKGVWGTISSTRNSVGDVQIDVGDIRPNYGVVLLSSTDGQPLESADSLVVLAASRSQNKGAIWNEARDSVGTNWGTGPTSVSSFDVTIRVPAKRKRQCFALSGEGDRLGEVPVTFDGKSISIKLGPKYKTLWYELR